MNVLKKIGVAVIALAVVAAIGYFWLQNNAQYRFGSSVAVVRQIQTLSNFETAQYSIDTVIEAGTEYEGLRQFFFGDTLLLLAHGNVVAGFDLSSVTDRDISGLGKRVNIKLPAPEVLHVSIDNERTRVFDRDRGLFTKGELNLEAEARLEAEEAVLKAACEDGILDQANQNAQEQLELLLVSAGFEEVTVTTQTGICSTAR